MKMTENYEVNKKVKEATKNVTMDVPISEMNLMLKLEVAREVVRDLSTQINHWLVASPVEKKVLQDRMQSLWTTLEVMEHCEHLFKEDENQSGDQGA